MLGLVDFNKAYKFKQKLCLISKSYVSLQHNFFPQLILCLNLIKFLKSYTVNG
jgi:hypothetical protein